MECFDLPRQCVELYISRRSFDICTAAKTLLGRRIAGAGNFAKTFETLTSPFMYHQTILMVSEHICSTTESSLRTCRTSQGQ